MGFTVEIPALEAEECPPKLHLQKMYFTEMYGIKVVQNYMFALTFAPMSGSNSDVATGVFFALHSLLLGKSGSGNF